MFLPRVSKLVVGENIKAVQELMIRVGRLQLFVCGFIFIWFLIFGKSFIELWVGPEYSSVYLCAVLFLIPIVIQLPQEIGMSYIIAANKVKSQSHIYIGMAVTNILLAIPLSKYYGVIGLSFAIFVAFSVRTISLDIMFHRKMKLNMLDFFKETFGRLFILFAISTLIFVGICYLPVGEGWFSLIAKSSISAVVYGIILIRVSFNEYERNLFLSFLKRK